MIIAIISDSHDNIPNTEKFLSWASKHSVDVIIHCGDITKPDLIRDHIRQSFSGPLYLVSGNAADKDGLIEISDQLDDVFFYENIGSISLDGINIGFCHFPKEAKDLAKTGQYNIVFYGHSHKPWTENIENTVLVNPGTLGGVFNKATFAVYDTKDHKLELKILELI